MTTLSVVSSRQSPVSSRGFLRRYGPAVESSRHPGTREGDVMKVFVRSVLIVGVLLAARPALADPNNECSLLPSQADLKAALTAAKSLSNGGGCAAPLGTSRRDRGTQAA